jgi:hypothetical protein
VNCELILRELIFRRLRVGLHLNTVACYQVPKWLGVHFEHGSDNLKRVMFPCSTVACYSSTPVPISPGQRTGLTQGKCTLY